MSELFICFGYLWLVLQTFSESPANVYNLFIPAPLDCLKIMHLTAVISCLSDSQTLQTISNNDVSTVPAAVACCSTHVSSLGMLRIANACKNNVTSFP
jgi:hypothetical protein